MPVSAFAFHGQPDFLPTTAGLLCQNPHFWHFRAAAGTLGQFGGKRRHGQAVFRAASASAGTTRRSHFLQQLSCKTKRRTVQCAVLFSAVRPVYAPAVTSAFACFTERRAMRLQCGLSAIQQTQLLRRNIVRLQGGFDDNQLITTECVNFHCFTNAVTRQLTV